MNDKNETREIKGMKKVSKRKQSDLIKKDLRSLLNKLRISEEVGDIMHSNFPLVYNTEGKEDYIYNLKKEIDQLMKKNYDKEIDMINKVYEFRRRLVDTEQDKHNLYEKYILDLEWVKLHYKEQEEINKKIIKRMIKELKK